MCPSGTFMCHRRRLGWSGASGLRQNRDTTCYAFCTACYIYIYIPPPSGLIFGAAGAAHPPEIVDSHPAEKTTYSKPKLNIGTLSMLKYHQHQKVRVSWNGCPSPVRTRPATVAFDIAPKHNRTEIHRWPENQANRHTRVPGSREAKPLPQRSIVLACSGWASGADIGLGSARSSKLSGPVLKHNLVHACWLSSGLVRILDFRF